MTSIKATSQNNWISPSEAPSKDSIKRVNAEHKAAIKKAEASAGHTIGDYQKRLKLGMGAAIGIPLIIGTAIGGIAALKTHNRANLAFGVADGLAAAIGISGSLLFYTPWYRFGWPEAQVADNADPKLGQELRDAKHATYTEKEAVMLGYTAERINTIAARMLAAADINKDGVIDVHRGPNAAIEGIAASADRTVEAKRLPEDMTDSIYHQVLTAAKSNNTTQVTGDQLAHQILADLRGPRAATGKGVWDPWDTPQRDNYFASN